MPELNRNIKFLTSVGWLSGKIIQANLSYGQLIYFFVSDHLKENKHWATFTSNEIYRWEYID